MKAYKLRVHGRVQGVFYRHTAKQQAEQLGLAGLARNESNGTVYMEIEGDDTALKQFIDWAHMGSPSAKVDEVQVQEIPAQNRQDFEII